MFPKEWVAESIAKDCRIAIHLYRKFPPTLYDWRPSPQQRSVGELLRYLSVCAISGLKAYREPEKGWRDVYNARAKEMDLSRFDETMERQAQEVLDFFRDLPDEELATRETKLPSGDVAKLGEVILNNVFKQLPAYKMQLFLYAKANGIVVSTPNLWRGVDPAS